MHTVNPDIDRPAGDIIDRFSGIPTAVLSDVTGKDTCTMGSEIKPVISDPMTVGSAFTVKSRPGDNLMVHKAITLAGAGDVLVIDANGYREAGLVGELLATSCKSNQLNGVIVDGAVRDTGPLEELGFPVFAAAVSPKGSSKKHPGSINVPVTCGGITVHPGDIIVGDADGVVSLDPSDAEAISEAVEQKVAEEERLKERVESGAFIYDVAELDERYDQLDIS